MFEEGLGLLAEPIKALGEGFDNFIEGVGDFFENLIDSLGTWFEDLGQWFDNLVNDLEQWFTNLGDDIGKIIDALNPASENFFLKAALIPSPEFMIKYVTDIKDTMDEKMGFFAEIRDFLGSIFGAVVETDPEPPKYEVSLPGGKWGTARVKLIDFSLFAQYRSYILNLIRVFLWIPFLMKLYRRLPSLIYQ